MTDADVDAVVSINQLNTDDVGPLDAAGLQAMLADSPIALAAVGPEGVVVGFGLVIDASCRHLTPRAAWALPAAAADLHLERVAFDMQYSGYGLGLALYEELDAEIERRAEATSSGQISLSSMVRLDPPNEHSIRFHESRGFEIVDHASFDGATFGVAVKRYGSAS